MAEVPIQNPITIPAKSYDVWHLRGFAIDVQPNGKFRTNVEFVPVLDTEEPLMTVDENGDPTPWLDAEGNERTTWDLHTTERRRYSIDDIQELARTKAAEGDSRYLQAVALILQLTVEQGVERGVIDVGS